MTARAWVLNLDADEELARPANYQPRADVLARFEVLASRLGPLIPPGDHVVDAAGSPSEPMISGAPPLGRAFCPTPRALALLRAAGAAPPLAPSIEVLRRVNGRGWSAALGLRLAGAVFAHSLNEVARAVATPPPTGSWMLKRAFGFAGRGRRDVRGGALSEEVRRWVEAALAMGGVEVAPRCDRLADFGLHGFLSLDGSLCLGEATVQRVNPRGAWLETGRAAPGDLEPAELAELEHEARRTAAALRAAGYFGPFGIDAFRWRDARGASHFHPRCEVNARYSMGWAVGMGDRRPDLDG